MFNILIPKWNSLSFMKDLSLSYVSSGICSAALSFSKTCLLKLGKMTSNWRFLETSNLQINRIRARTDPLRKLPFPFGLSTSSASCLVYLWNCLSWSIISESKIIPQFYYLAHLNIVLGGILCCYCVWERSSSKNLEVAWSPIVGSPHLFCWGHASFPGYQLQSL